MFELGSQGVSKPVIMFDHGGTAGVQKLQCSWTVQQGVHQYSGVRQGYRNYSAVVHYSKGYISTVGYGRGTEAASIPARPVTVN